ncbi:MAG: IPT/TIG domain-containing protein [Pyrinomonadaceae bacterium]|nr:IPT/TIG domain-containing protein [Pyrinomonadaceae bacterium]
MSKLTNEKYLIRFKKTISFILAYCIALQFLVFSVPQNAEAKVQTNQPITPIVECVQNSGSGNFTAWFGYNNPNANAVSIPVSAAQNKFTPTPFDRGQTTNFLSGRQKYAFSVDYSGNGKFIWHLNRKTATASSVFPTNCQQVDVEILSHTNNQVVNSATVNLRGKAYNLLPSSSIANVFVNNTNASFNTSTKEWTFNNFALSEGNNVVNVRAIDNAGNEANTSITIVYQNTTPRITSIEVNRGTQGQNLQVTINGQNTNWTQGQTRALFGGEIAVGGSAEGELGLVTVVNQTTATADLVINSKASLSPRNVRIVTNSEDINSPNAFTVLPVSPTGSATNNVTTIAGNAGQSGFADGVGNTARFNNLSGITLGNDDAVYVADAGNNRIRVVRQQVGGNWLAITLAGDGTQGFQDGQGNQARFNNPNGVAVFNDGTVYVADSGNHSIRKILANGTVSTFAGNGTQGFQDGQGNAATFNNPNGIAIDNSGNLYVADTGNSAVRKIDTSGNVVTLAGDGTVGSNHSPNARFNGLAGVTVDGANVYVYIADGQNHTIRRFDTSGNVLTIAGSLRGFADGTPNDSRFANPNGIAFDGNGRLIISDTVNSLIRSVSPNSDVSTVAGAGEYGSTDGVGNVAKFRLPKGIAVSRSSAIFVADSGNQTLRRIGVPPRILSFTPTNGRIGDAVTIFGENFDGRLASNNTVTFAKVGGGTTQATVTNATRSQLFVVVPADATTGRIAVTTQDGTSESLTDFTVEQNPSPVITDFTPRRGQVGTTVKLFGTNLKSGNTNPNVTFAGSNNTRLNALVNSATATEVNVLVPNGAITGRIELTTAWGNAQTGQDFIVDETQQFQLVVSPSTVQVVERTRGTAVVSLTSPNSTFTQLARLSAINLPNGVTTAFEPEQITSGGTSTLKLNLANSAISSGSYQFTVRGTAWIDGNEVTEDTNVSLSVLPAGQTTLSGRVLNTDSEPIIGATVSLDGQTATTDSSGSFLLSGVTAGNLRPLQIDGRTANSPNRTYPVITEPADIVAGQANEVPYIFYLPPIDVQHEVDVIPTQETIVQNPRVEGLKMMIPANANLRNRDGTPVTRVSITPLAIDRTPTPLPTNVSMALVYTAQPGGALSDKPIPVIFPNLLGTDPGTVVELYAFNHDTVQWYVYGFGTVSQDGKSITPNINPNTNEPYGLTDFSWFGPSGPPNPGDPRGGGRGGRGGRGGGRGDGSGDEPCDDSNEGNSPGRKARRIHRHFY